MSQALKTYSKGAPFYNVWLTGLTVPETLQEVWAGHSETLCAFAEAHYTPSIGLPERPHGVLRVYISMTGPGSQRLRHRVLFA
jgi:hypothetical protein